jgi:pimeloyl-ACP methyl ester carboxylesterase
MKSEIRPGRKMNIALYHPSGNHGTIFFIHGLGGRGEQFRNQLDVFKDKYLLVIPDLLGHGDSDKPKSEVTQTYSFQALEMDLDLIFRQHATENNIIIGHSYGGALATVLALNHQDKVSHLILISPTPCLPHLQIPFIYHLPIFLMEMIRPWLDKQFQKLAFDTKADKALLAEELQAMQKNSMDVIKSVVKGMQNMPAIDIAHLTTPTLIIIGEQDKIIPPAAQENFYQALPHHLFKIIPHAAHLPMLEKAKEVNELMVRFIDSPLQV